MMEGLKTLQRVYRTDPHETSDSIFPPSRRERAQSYQDEKDDLDDDVIMEETLAMLSLLILLTQSLL